MALILLLNHVATLKSDSIVMKAHVFEKFNF